MDRSTEGAVLRAWKTVVEMLGDRGWSTAAAAGVGDEEVLRLAADFQTFGINVNDAGDRVVFFTAPQGLKKQDVFAAADDAKRIVLVTRSKLSTATVKSLHADKDGRELHEFTLEELQFNVSKHELQPAFSVMSAAEEAAVMRALGIENRFLLPVILHTDPMARYLGLHRGQIVRIVRKNQTSGESVNYRCCA